MQDSELPFWLECWLVMEMARTDNRIEIKSRYSRIFHKKLTESEIELVFKTRLDSIQFLKAMIRTDIEAHPLSDPYKRLNEYAEIAETCKNGFYTGATDITGMPVIRQDPATRLKAIQAAGQEQNLQVQNQLKLLQVMVQGDRMGINFSEGSAIVDASNIKLIPPSDNDKFFEE